jgi:hypothetical protein
LLTTAGVPVSLRRYEAFHGFLAFAGQLEVAVGAFDDIGATVRDLVDA